MCYGVYKVSKNSLAGKVMTPEECPKNSPVEKGMTQERCPKNSLVEKGMTQEGVEPKEGSIGRRAGRKPQLGSNRHSTGFS